MKKQSVGVVFILAVGLSCVWCGAARADERVVDDFESYEAGQVIGPSAVSKPWKRFGDATNDNLVVVGQADRVISGSQSAQYCVVWPGSFGILRYSFEKPADLSGYVAVSFKVRSADVRYAQSEGEESQYVGDTHTTVTLTLSNSSTTYEAVVAKPLSSEPQTYTIFLTEGILVPVEGLHRFSALLSGVHEIGLTFRSTGGEYTETIIIDDLKLLTHQVATSNSQ